MELFIYLTSQRVVICTDSSCRYAVLSSNINIYLRVQYRMLVGKRREIINYIISIPNLIINEEYLKLINLNLLLNHPAIF